MRLSRDVIKPTLFILILSMTSAVLAMPIMQAEAGTTVTGGTPGTPAWGPLPSGTTPDYTVTTYAYISLRPNPIGLGQSLLINIWITPSVHRSCYLTGFTVKITKPDGTTDTVGPLNSYYGDCTAWFEYVPDQIGTWKFQFIYAGTYFPAGLYSDAGWPSSFGSGQTRMNYSRWYKPAESLVIEQIVQADMVASWPPAALPTDYWTRPVHFENREWWTILGNYPWSGSGVGYPDWPEGTNRFQAATKYNAWVKASTTPHIVWKRLDAISGIIGGPAGFEALTSSGNAPSLIYAGRCYDTVTVPINGVPTSCAVCYDLRTGEQYYAISTSEGGTTPSYISYVYGTSTEVPGATERLGVSIELLSIGSRLLKINPLTGAVTTNVTGWSGGTFIDPYVIVLQTNNSATGPRLINWTTAGTSTNFTSRVVENRSVSLTSIGSNIDWETGLFGSLQSLSYNGAYYGVRIVGYSIKTGQMTCNNTDDLIPYTTSQTVVDHGKIACLMQDGYVGCYDLATGKRLWKSQQTYTTGGYPWGIWGAYSSASYGGNMILCEYDGVYAINWDTGKISWVYRDPSVPFETPYTANSTEGTGFGVNPFNTGVSIADGMVFTYNTEHTQTHPITRGWKFHCINATTGEGIWNITTPMSPSGMADGYTTAQAQDGYMYVFGKGKSATTATTTPAVVKKGDTVLIQGTVTDQSAAQAGTPCVSRGSMTTQMEYLHMQAPIDGIWHNLTMTGVPVTLTAIGSYGSVIDIGTATTSAYYGTFSKAWTPPNEGTYEIVVSFAGDDSYGSSATSTGLSVGPAAAEISIPEQITPTDYTTAIMYGVIAIIIAVVISVAVAVLILRKR